MNDKYGYLYIYIFILALIFYIIGNYETNVLISIIIIFIIGYLFYLKINNDLEKNQYEEKKIKDKINNNLVDISYFNSLNSNINKIPKEFKYLLKDDILTQIILDINFINKFNKTLYIDIILNMDKLMKIYIYILNNIYHPTQYISSFIETKKNILELLNSVKLNVPIISKYTIGFNLHNRVDKSIMLFKMRVRKMITIIHNYSNYEKNIYLEDIEIEPSNL
tara:strand:- start:2677 stop:3342 length:666 start_codon:yes stop_codon:yes gene_type:complete